MVSFTLTHEQMRSIVSVATAASKDDVTPVLQHIHIEFFDDSVTAIATDRYRVARSVFGVDSERIKERTDDAVVALVPAKQIVKFYNSVKTEAVKNGAFFPVEIEYLDSRDKYGVATFSCYGSSVRMEPVGIGMQANYPPVWKIIDDHVAKENSGVPEMVLNTDFVADVAKLWSPKDTGRKRDNVWVFKFTPMDERKPAPLYAMQGEERGDRIEYLLQPQLRLR